MRSQTGLSPLAAMAAFAADGLAPYVPSWATGCVLLCLAMPFLLFGQKGKARRVPDGQFEKRRCPECGKTTVFRECVVEKTYTAYRVINLWKSESTQFSCDACGALMDLDDTEPAELSAREQAQQQAIEAKRAAVEAKRTKVEAKREQARSLKEAAEREQSIDDELAEMRSRLGLTKDK